MRLAVPLLPGLWLGRLLWQYAGGGSQAGIFLSIGVLLIGGWCLCVGIYSLHRRACHGELRSYVSFGISVCFLFFSSDCGVPFMCGRTYVGFGRTRNVSIMPYC